MLEKVKAGINKGILSASVSSGTYLEIEKVKGKIEIEKKAVERALDELGRNLYQHWKEGRLESLDINQYCINIETHYTNINSFQLDIRRLEEEKNKILGKNSALVMEEQQEHEADKTKICICGTLCNSRAKFCPKCGKPV